MAAGASMVPNCPLDLHHFADVAKGLTVTEPPRLETFTAQQTRYHADDTTEPAFYFQTYSMRFTFTRDGRPWSERMYFVGHVDVSRLPGLLIESSAA